MRAFRASRSSRASRATRLLLLAGALLLAWPSTALAAQPLPNSMASTGDSITRAFNTCFFPYVDCPSNSWATGSSSTVNSHYLRIRAGNAAINGRAWNDAKSGAKMANLPAQMTTVSGRNVKYVTVQMGGNDFCTSSTATMTSVNAFRASFTQAMQTITANPAVTTVYVTSIPDAYRLWELFRNNANARSTWWLFGVCQSLLARPTSTQQADVDRRNAVRARNVAFNQVLEEVCAGYEVCAWDGWTVFCTAFATTDVTTRDYFHPSTAGQKKLADVSWRAGPFVASPTPYLGSDCVP
jgi:lysophospholipase L1-like esterase